VIYDAIALGIPLSRIHDITKIDMWFLKQYEELYTLEKEISTYKVETLPKELLLKQNKKGFADRQIDT
jgi:carbamoyl-phosphate synthase large subunit